MAAIQSEITGSPEISPVSGQIPPKTLLRFGLYLQGCGDCLYETTATLSEIAEANANLAEREIPHRYLLCAS